MRIVIATGLYPPEIGGPATYTALMETALPTLGHVVTVVPFSRVRAQPKIIRHIVYTRNLIRAARDADIILALDTVSVGLPSLVCAWITHTKLVVRVPGDYAWEQGRQRFGVRESLEDFQKRSHNPLVMFLQYIQALVVTQAAQVIVPSTFMAHLVQRWGVPHERITTIESSIEPLPETIIPHAVVAGVTIVSVGRLVPWKGFKELIDAVAAEGHWRLVIIGEGPQREELERYATTRDMRARVHFAGALPREEMLSWVKAADVFVLYSEYEGLSHVLVEAMALGSLVVVSDIPGNRAVVSHDADGTLVPVHQVAALTAAIQGMLAHPQKDVVRAAARKRANDFSIEVTVRKVAELLNSVCAS